MYQAEDFVGLGGYYFVVAVSSLAMCNCNSKVFGTVRGNYWLVVSGIRGSSCVLCPEL